MAVQLRKLYHDYSSPYGLSSSKKLWQKAKEINPKITKHEIDKFLQTNRTYTLHKLQRKKFPRQKVLASKPRVIMACDLADMRHLMKYNSNVGYLLVCVDVFSRYMQVAAVKQKKATSMLASLQSILESSKSQGTSLLNTDNGSEFYNKKVQSYLASKNIKLYSVHSREIKAAIAERGIQTLKNRIYRYLTSQNTLRYIDHLPEFVDAYNTSPHSGLKNNQTPSQIHSLNRKADIIRQWHLMYKNNSRADSTISSKLVIGQTVRIVKSSRSSLFNKGYLQQNTEEIFRIREIKHKTPPRTYLLEDLSGQPIYGVFYRPELIPTTLPETYSIDILRTRRRNNKKQYFVHWVGYPDSFNSWVDQKDITSYNEHSSEQDASHSHSS